MKSIKKYILSLGVVAAAMSLGSCTGDLDLQPIDPSTVNSSQFADDPEGYMNRVLAEIYQSFVTFGPNGDSQIKAADGGMTTFQRAIFNLEEIPTDEASWFSSSDAGLFTLQYGNISSDNDMILATYSRLLVNIALCNSFIQAYNNGDFHLTGDLVAKGEDAVRQCKILRSACYFYLIDLFGNVPYADETVAIGTNAPQLSRAEIFNLVTKTLEDVIAEYGSANKAAAYGYIGKDVAQGVLVKYYLNAEVFTGTPRWNDCLRVANDLISAHKGTGFRNSGLAENWFDIVSAKNKDFAIGGSNACSEILWILPADADHIESYSGAALLMLAGIKTDEEKARIGVGNGWGCFKGRPQLVNRFQWNEPTQATSPDKRVAFWSTSKDGYTNEMKNMTLSDWTESGYTQTKLINRYLNADGTVNMNDDGLAPASGDGRVTTACPMLRLSEIYLSAAEAILHGAGAKADALEYVNLIRERAGVRAWQANELTLETLQDERCRELYQENCRRTDLIRYGKWTSGYNWAWKGNAANGTDFPAYYNLYPIPAQIVSMSTYKQNPGY